MTTQKSSTFNTFSFREHQGSLQPKTPSNLDWDTIFQSTPYQLDELLLKRSYPIQLDTGKTTIGRMEIKVLAQLLKGQNSQEIACELKIKKTTVESYLINIKNKLGVNLKSELIQKIISYRLFHQITL